MGSPAQNHFNKVLAAKRGDCEFENTRAQNQYELMLMQLAEHRRTLKRVQSLDRKLETKTKFLPEYEAYIAGVLEGNAGVQDEVFVTVLLWYIDTGNIDQALPLAQYALQHDLALPDRFERTLACTLAEETAETAARLFESGKAIASKALGQLVALTADHDMYDQARAKLFRQLGQALEAEDKPEKAIEAYKQALTLNPKVGVKKFIEKLERDLKKVASGTQTTNNVPEPGAG
ncbi:phage terminase small subunit [Pseudoalteromonas rubra]|uniref:phage terminase small subunit n=1 Tax=Pseudoalteromonas rubra TaxID=43658 RepID=UPI002DBB1811|nr:phage terminase small subunit [Pseudoalteromonas rubra]MEC4090149.1 phage terminase small subunit [Pseudoalteromonas rubra]